MTAPPKSGRDRILPAYYAGTALFLVLDYGLDLNVRLAFLEDAPAWRGLYYLFCFGCFGLMAWRPALGPATGMVESLITLTLLIVNMALRVVIVTDEMIETGRGVVTYAEIVNFLLASGVVYVSYLRGMAELRR